MFKELIHKRKKKRVEMLENEQERVKSELIKMGARKIILFGSSARKEIGLLSDIDIIAIMQTKMGFVDRTREIYRNIKPRSVDILVYTPKEFSRMKNSAFLRNSLKDSKVLYEEKTIR